MGEGLIYQMSCVRVSPDRKREETERGICCILQNAIMRVCSKTVLQLQYNKIKLRVKIPTALQSFHYQ